MTAAPTLSGGLLTGGDRITDASGGAYAHICPASGQPNAHIQLAGAGEIDRAVTSARDAHREWMSLTVDRRRDLLIDLADAVHESLDELARLNVHDYAVPISFAGNAILLERFLRHFAGYVDKPHGATTPVTGSFDVNLIEREPYGVVGVITPWNGSLVVTANIIFGDADLDAAVMLSAHQGPLMQSGQSCACAGRVLVHESVYDAFLEKFVGVIEASTVGDPLDPQGCSGR